MEVVRSENSGRIDFVAELKSAGVRWRALLTWLQTVLPLTKATRQKQERMLAAAKRRNNLFSTIERKHKYRLHERLFDAQYRHAPSRSFLNTGIGPSLITPRSRTKAKHEELVAFNSNLGRRMQTTSASSSQEPQLRSRRPLLLSALLLTTVLGAFTYTYYFQYETLL